MLNAVFPFDTVALTAPNKRAAKAYREELTLLFPQDKGSSSISLHAIADPDGIRIGSGGATLNVIASLPRKESDRILLIHSGGDSQRSPTQSVCGKAWSAVNTGGGISPLELLLVRCFDMFKDFKPGSNCLVVACSDVLLMIPPCVCNWTINNKAGAVGLALLAPPTFAPHHGVYVLEEEVKAGSESAAKPEPVLQYLQKPTPEEAQAAGAIRSSNSVAIDTGLIAFDGPTTAALQRLAHAPELRGVTDQGIAEGVPPLRLELYSDLLLALRTGKSNTPDGNDIKNGITHSSFSFEEDLAKYMVACGNGGGSGADIARRLIYSELGDKQLGALLLDGSFAHTGTTAELLRMATLKEESWVQHLNLTHRSGCNISPICQVHEEATIVNTIISGDVKIGTGTLIEHCYLVGTDNTSIVAEGESPQSSTSSSQSNSSHASLGSQWCIGEGCVVAGIRCAGESLHVLPGLVLQETCLNAVEGLSVLSCIAVNDDIKADCDAPSATIMGGSWQSWLHARGLHVENVWPGLPSGKRTLWQARIFPVFRTTDPTERSRALQWLGCHSSAALPSGLEANFELLSLADILRTADPAAEFKWRRLLKEIIKATSENTHADSPTTLSSRVSDIVVKGKGAIICAARAPARIDLAGGWTDTPPICFEAGGAVSNAAVTVDGILPLQAWAYRCEVGKSPSQPQLILRCHHAGASPLEVICSTVQDIENYNIPTAPAALLKACAVCCGLVQIGGDAPLLSTQLRDRYGGSVVVVTNSALPTGSGMGSSSILAGVVLRVMYFIIGRTVSLADILLQVVEVEKLMTTCGGWQDQVGGLVGGIKITRCNASYPLVLNVTQLPTPIALKGRLALVFTGTPRLAKNLLQSVVGMWQTGELVATDTVNRLKQEAEKSAKAVTKAVTSGELVELGESLSEYWRLKKILAENAEPEDIRLLLDTVRPLCSGVSLCGAGGGGYAVLLLKDENHFDDVRLAVSNAGSINAGVQIAEVHEGGLEYEELYVPSIQDYFASI